MLPKLGDIALTLSARAFAMIGPFGVSIITARALGPEDRGRYFLVFSFAQIAAQIANLGLPSSNTYLAARRPDLVGQLTVNSLYVAIIFAPLCALGTVLVMERPDLLGFAPPAGGLVGPVVYFAALLAPLMVAFSFFSNLAVAVGRVTLFNSLNVGYSIGALLVAGVVGLVGGWVSAFLVGAACAVGALTLVAGLLLLRGASVSFCFDFALLRRGVSFSLRAYLATMFGFLLSRVGIIALQHQGDLVAVGQFSIAVQLSDALVLLPATIGLLLFPSLLRTTGSVARWRAHWQAFWGLGTVMAVLLLASALVAPWLVPLVFGANYGAAVPLFIAMLPQVMILSLITVISQYLAAEGYPWRQVFAWVVGFLVQCGLSWWLASVWGGFGVAISLAISHAVVIGILFSSVRLKRNELSADREKPAGIGNEVRNA